MSIKFGKIIIRPEVDEPKYYVHIAILVGVVLFLLNNLFGHNMMTFDWFWKLSVAVILSDIIAHSILKLD